jgi:hypothetical protein
MRTTRCGSRSLLSLNSPPSLDANACGPQKFSLSFLSNLPFQAIFVMQAAQYRTRFDSVTDGELMPVPAGGDLRSVWLRNARA